MFLSNDSVYYHLNLADTTKHYVLMDNNSILVLNNQLEIVKHIDKGKYYFCNLEENGYKYYSNEFSSIIINASNEMIAHLDIYARTVKVGSKLYAVQNKSLVEIDLNDIW